MPVHIGQMTTDVTAEAAPAPTAGSTETPAAWSEVERCRKARERDVGIRIRTRAYAFDD